MCLVGTYTDATGGAARVDMANILLIEDERDTAEIIARGLGENGHTVRHETRGDLGYELAMGNLFDLLIVDRMLPGLEGLKLVQSLRARDVCTPVLFLSNLGGLNERVEGLNAGGDDYLGKPFGFTELLARVNALLRRPLSTGEQSTLKIADLEMNLIRRRVMRAGREIDLLPREFTLLEYLLRRPEQVVTRTMLLEGVWDYHFDPKTNIVETHISRLRAKIGSDLVQTIRGSGYMIRANRTHA